MSGWAGTRVLVTGAGGFIGSHVVDALVAAGADVRAFLRYTAHGHPGALAWSSAAAEVERHYGDLRDADSVDEAMRGRDAALHLGAHISVAHSYSAPRSVSETNVMGTLNVLLAARHHDVARVAVVSTSEVYGTPESVPIRETHPLNAQSPYAATKVGADMLALAFHRSYGVPVGVLRPFNTYGPRQSRRAVIPTILAQALAGSELRLGSLDPSRDFVFVDDTVRGLLAFGAWSDAPGSVVQLGTGTATTVRELVAIAEELVGRRLEVTTESERVRPPASEVRTLLADPSVAREALGWSPEVGVRDGMRRTLEWLEANQASFLGHEAVR